MKKQFLLTLWIVLIVNGIIWLWFYILNTNFVFLNWWSSLTWNIVVKKHETVVNQNITKTYDITNIQSQLIDTIKKVSDSVVSIVISKNLNVYYYSDPYSIKPFVERKKEKIGGWSWIIVSSNWYILTNKHVVENYDADYSVVTKDGNIYKVDKIRTDPILDIAVIHVVNQDGTTTYDLKPAKIADFKTIPHIWEFVLAIWYPFAQYSNTTTLWILSAKWRKLENNNGSLYVGLYQTDTAINPWNSWWPLIDIDGQVIWVNTAISSQWWWIWFSIPINKEFVDSTLNSIEKNWVIKRPLLWVKLMTLTKTLAKKLKLWKYKWAFIQEVLPNSPAFKFWLKKWDIITQVDGLDITEDTPIIYTLFTHNIWDVVDLTIYRDWKLVKEEIKLFEF